MSRKISLRWRKLRSAQSPGHTTGAARDEQVRTIVSGLPRSGTSMMMKMLEAGGMPPLTDKIREPDADNPKGYYEFERVKKLDKGDSAWLTEAHGKAIKVIAALLRYLPSNYHYKVIFMQRNLEETLVSQKQMLVRRGKPTDDVADEEMAGLFRKHLAQIETWLEEQPNFEVLYISYNAVLDNAVTEAHKINHFLGGTLRVEAMAGAVDPSLYRQRR